VKTPPGQLRKLMRWREYLLRMVRRSEPEISNAEPVDSEGLYDISRDIYHVRQLFYPIKTDSDTATVVGGFAVVTIQPTEGEVWLVENISVSHNDTANRNIRLLYDEDTAASPGIYLTPDTGVTVVKSVNTPIYPSFHDIAGVSDVYVTGLGPLCACENIRIQVVLLNATNGKTLTVHYAYRRVV
jgi:hypothetical protein